MHLLIPLLLALVQSPSSKAAPDPCSYDRPAMLALDPAHFDHDLKGGGWRGLGDRPGCAVAAADLLAAYRAAHWGALKPGELHINYWHEGQMRATAGNGRDAVPLLLAGVASPDKADFADYALGTWRG
jgi:hypothetical protein